MNEFIAFYTTTSPPEFARWYHAIDRDFKDFYRQEMVYRAAVMRNTIWVDEVQCKPDGAVDRRLRKLTFEIDYIYHVLDVDKSDFAMK